ncbi:hypothetical protein IHE45_19G051900 [Dioscorea alata]|nr:hypothetical protein IHE45_19G051900 [Dioscorea alata]
MLGILNFFILFPPCYFSPSPFSFPNWWWDHSCAIIYFWPKLFIVGWVYVVMVDLHVCIHHVARMYKFFWLLIVTINSTNCVRAR